MKTGKAFSKRRIFGTILAIIMLIAIALTGTYAWVHIQENALNEVKGNGSNPGGRVHDDFDGENKDVYAENFGNKPIYVRIMLSEYMEIGGASFASGATKDDMTSWTPHNPSGDVDPAICGNADLDLFHDYWKWTMGGDKIFMPTFNKDKDSLKIDYTGKEAWSLASSEYDYKVSDPTHATDADGIGNFLMAKPGSHTDWTNGENFTAIEYRTGANSSETHTAKSTLTQDHDVITLAQWLALGAPSGNFWVIDTDGWAYWAAPLQKGEATSLLLSKIEMTQTPEDEWYYAINVIGEFYDRDGLKTFASVPAVWKAEGISVAITGPASIKTDSTETFSAEVTRFGTPVSEQDVTWSLVGTYEAGTEIDPATGVLTVAAGETALEIVIKATSNEYGVSVEKTVLISDVVYTIEIDYSPSPVANDGKPVTFTALVKADGSPVADSVTWSLVSQNPISATGISFNSATGVLTMAPDSNATSVTIRALHSSGVYEDIVVDLTLGHIVYSLEITGSGSINKNASSTYTAAVKADGSTAGVDQDVVWSISSFGHATGTFINAATGVLTVADDETKGAITIRAKSVLGEIENTKVITVVDYTLFFSEGNIDIGSAATPATTVTVNLANPQGAATERYFATSSAVTGWMFDAGTTGATMIAGTPDKSYKISFPGGAANGTATLTVGGYTVIFNVSASGGANIGDTMFADGIDWRILAKDGAQALIIAEHVQFDSQMHDVGVNWDTATMWAGSNLRKALNGTAGLTDMSNADSWYAARNGSFIGSIVPTNLKTKIGINGPDYDESVTAQTFFLLSEDEVFGTSSGGNPINNLFSGATLFGDNYARRATTLASTDTWWCRSPRISKNSAVTVFSSSGNINSSDVLYVRGVRPACVINLP